MESIGIFIFRINTIASKAAAQTVAAVMHNLNGFYNFAAVNPFAAAREN